jgi:hypothetical protein
MMMRACVAAVLMLAGLSGPSHGQVKLEWKLKKGDRFFVETVTTKTGTLTVGDKKTALESVNTIVAAFTVLDKTADGYLVEEEIQLVRDKPTTGITSLAKAVLKARLEPYFEPKTKKPMKGAVFTIVLRPNGAVQLSGYDKVTRRLAGELEAPTGGSSRSPDPTTLKAVRELMPEESWKGFVEDIFSVVPTGPVAKGNTWTRSTKVGLGALGSFASRFHYTFKEKNRDGGEIDVKAEMKYSAPANPSTDLPFKITAGEIKSESAGGSTVFDPDTGRLVRSTMTIHFKGTLTLEAGGIKSTLQVDQRQTAVSRVLDHNPIKPR